MRKQIYIAGASYRGQTLKEYLTFLDPEIVVKAFLVDDLDENPECVQEIPVLKIPRKDCEPDRLCADFPVYLATRGVYHEDLSVELRRLGFNNIIPVTVDLDRNLRNQYVKKKYEECGKPFVMIDDFKKSDGNTNKQAVIYVATSAVDKALKSSYKLTADEMVIQVGAVLTEERIIGNTAYDDQGDNISEKNRQYCELTALYWAWKNSSADIIGLCHYRRHFLLPKDWLARFERETVDVIIPVPLYVAPNVAENYRIRHDAAAWDFMMNYLKDHYPDDYDKADCFFKENLYSPCNMLIARREVLDDLCAWMFPIIDAVVRYAGDREDVYANRYPACLAERMMTYFFETNRDRYKIVYADKNFLS